MRIVSFTVERFRSITKAHKIRLEDYTVLVGPNNEGKSNILRALTLGMRILAAYQNAGLGRTSLVRVQTRREYNWRSDFPLHLQGKKGTPQKSVVTIEVELNDQELSEFQLVIGSKLNGLLPIAITFGSDGVESLTVMKQGRGGPALTKKSPAIAKFISSKLRFEHIPAVRTAQTAKRVVEDLVALELGNLEKEPAFIDAVAKIAALQAPILEEVSRRIRSTLLPFLPKLAGVEVNIPDARRYEALRRSCKIFLDDGARTPLEHKGDGVQSLAALGLMRDFSGPTSGGKHLVVAVEEPESHLHPKAIHELRSLLVQLSVEHQVLITTHNPLFIDRSRWGRNVIVRDKKAKPATSMGELREVLGVRASDNLQHASMVLVVEGECDRVALSALLSHQSPELHNALSNGLLSLDALHGGMKLGYKLSNLRNSLYLFHVFLDADQAGIDAAKGAIKEGLLSESEVSYATYPGRKEAELEDWVDPSCYSEALLQECGVDITSRRFGGRAKWSARMEELCTHQGKLWNNGVKVRAKTIVAQAIAQAPNAALLPPAREVLSALVGVLVERLPSQ